MKRAELALIVMFLAPAFTLAQTSQNSWDNLRKLAPGQPIRVVLKDAKSYSGPFQSVSDNELVLRIGGEQQTLARRDVLRVSTKGVSHRLRNGLIGAGIGAAVGVAWGVSCDYREAIGCGGPAAAFGIAAFAPMGFGAGALIPTGGWHDVYRAR